MSCNCVERIRKELPDIAPSGGYDEVDEVLGLLRVARTRENQAEQLYEKARRRLSLETLRYANVSRCEQVFHPVKAWTPTDWACALAGEAGEVCNGVKKLRRLADGTNTAKDPQTEAEAIAAIAIELADTIIYADLLAARLGINLAEAVRTKFNAVSELRNSTVRLEVENTKLI